MENRREQEKRPDQIMEESIVGLVKSKNMTGADLRTAYLLSLGVTADELGYEKNENIEDLSAKLKSFFDQGLPLNSVVDLISSREKYEGLVDEFSNLVGKLLLTEKEKKILISIVEQQRQGTLSILADKSNTKIDELQIAAGKEMPKEDIAFRLIAFLGRFQNFKGLAIEFSS